MNFTASTLITFIALIYYSVLLVVILRRSIYSQVRLFFSLHLLSMIVWSFAAFMMFSDTAIMDALFWNRVLVIGSMGMPVSFYNFVRSFLGKESRVWIWVSFLSYLSVEAFNISGLVISSATTEGSLFVNEYGPALPIASTFWLFFIGASAFELFVEYRKSRDVMYRNRLWYLFLTIIVIFTGNLTNLTDLKFLPTDIAANVLAAMLITFAILRHRLLDISVVIRKGILYSIPTVLIGAAYYLAIQGVIHLVPDITGFNLFLLSVVAAIVTAMFVQPLQSLAQTWVDRLFFREKYDASRMLEQISRTVTHVLDLETITQMILNEVTETLHVSRGAFLIKWQNTGDYVLAAEKGLDHITNIRWSRDHPIVRMFVGRETPITRQNMEAMLRNITLTQEQRVELNRLDIQLFIPLNAKGNLVGIFLLGLKLSELTYTDDDQLILTTLANQTAVAVENARLFSAEQSRREELDALYELTRQLVATNDVDHVIQNTTRHVVTSAHVTFSRILTPDTNGGFYCRSAFPIRNIDYNLGAERFEPEIALPYYQQSLHKSEPTFLQRNEPGLNEDIQTALMLDLATTICMCPLRVGDQALGLLILGERREANREPFDADKMRLVLAIADQAANALQRANMHEQMENTFLETVLALANAMDARDTYTNDHSQRMCTLAEVTCREIGSSSDDIWAVHWASLLHDIGKIGVPDRILRKNGALTNEEWLLMKKHPEIGARIVAPVKKLENVAPLIQAHHERYDGTGYPYGLKGSEIPQGARILAIVDAYTAMTDDRVYRKPRKLKEAIQELRDGAGTQFDPYFVNVFIQLLEKEAFSQFSQLVLLPNSKEKE